MNLAFRDFGLSPPTSAHCLASSSRCARGDRPRMGVHDMRTSARVVKALGWTVLALALFPSPTLQRRRCNGTVTGSSGWYHDWSFAGPSASMTGSLSSAQHNSYSSVGQNMKQPDPLDPSGAELLVVPATTSSVYANWTSRTPPASRWSTRDNSPGAACAGVAGPTTAGSQTNCGVVDTLNPVR